MIDRSDTFEPRIADLPLPGMGDRRFELLAWGLLDAEVSEHSAYDKAVLLSQGPDRGRDIILYKGDQTVGIVQCKCLKSNITRPDVIVELAKFAMFRLRDASGPTETDQYELWCASNLSEPARLLFDETATHIDDALSDVAGIVSKLRVKFASFAELPEGYTEDSEFNAVRQIIKGLRLKYKVAHHINALAQAHARVRRVHFRSPDDALWTVESAEVDQGVFKRRQVQLQVFATQGRAGAHPYSPDSDLDAAFQAFALSDAVAMAITSEAGAGKSTWAARMLEAPPFDLPILVVSGEEILATDTDAISTISRLVVPGQAAQPSARLAVEQWLSRSEPVVIIDGLDRVRAAAREGLGDWLRQTKAQLPLHGSRFVVTSRPQAWSDLKADFGAVALGPSREHHLKLTYPQVLELYRAYGIDRYAHGHRLLPTPSMIALLARVQSEIDGRVTRSDLLAPFVATVKKDVRRLTGVGPTEADLAFEALEQLFGCSLDHRVNVAELASRTRPAIVDALVDSGFLLRLDGFVRPVLDEALEFLLSKTMSVPTVDDIKALLAIDEVGIGALALRLAMSAATEQAKVDELLDALLSVGGDRAARVVAKILVEQRDHTRHVERIRRLFSGWSQANFLLLGSPVGELLLNNSLSDDQQLAAVLELAQHEDPLDWRRKYMTDADRQGGRIITPFHTAATRLVDRLGAASIPILLPLLQRGIPAPDVAKGLATEAVVAVSKPSGIALLDWPFEARSEVLANAVRRHPKDIAPMIVELRLEQLLSNEEAVALVSLVGRAHSHEPQIAIAASAAGILLPLTEVPEDRAALLTMLLDHQYDEVLATELMNLVGRIDQHTFWYGVSVLGEKVRPLIRRAVATSLDPVGQPDLLTLAAGIELPLALCEMLLQELKAVPLDRSGAVLRARALEGLLYTYEAARSEDGMPLAFEYSRWTDPDVRLPLIYFAASRPIGNDIDRDWATSKRDALLAALIEAETGENISVLVWKLVSGSDLEWTIDHLVALCLRLGEAPVVEQVESHAFMNSATDTIIDGVRKQLQVKA